MRCPYLHALDINNNLNYTKISAAQAVMRVPLQKKGVEHTYHIQYNLGFSNFINVYVCCILVPDDQTCFKSIIEAI